MPRDLDVPPREPQRWPGRLWKLALSAAVLAVYAALGLSAHRFEPQSPWLENGVVATRDEGLYFFAPGSARAAQPPEWLPAAIRTSSIEVRVEARTYGAAQFGPARIFTISVDPGHRNLTIGQHGDSLVVRLRTVATDENGRPAYEIPGVFADQELHSIVVDVDGKALRLTVDGAMARSDVLPDDPLSNWDSGYPLVLGNEEGGQRPWLGEIRRATVRVGDRSYEYAGAAALSVPEYYKLRGQAPVSVQSALRGDGLPLSDNAYGAIRDAANNLGGFIPLGLVLALLWRRRPVASLVIACVVISALIEICQLVLPGRYPHIDDFVLNVLGGTAGVLGGRWLVASLPSRRRADP